MSRLDISYRSILLRASHNIYSMFRTTVRQYLEIGFTGLFLHLGNMFLLFVRRFRNKTFIRIVAILHFLFLLLFYILWSVIFALFPFVSYSFVFIVERPSSIKTVALAAGMLLVIQPLGSDGAC